MTDQPMLTLADIWSTLSAAYWVCLIVGGGLLTISVLGAFGGHADADFDVSADADVDLDGVGGFDVGHDFDMGHDVDIGHDVDLSHDVDAGHDFEAAHYGSISSVSTWFSMRFLVFFVAAFGAIGAIFTHLSDITAPVILLVALAGGMIIGQVAHQTFRTIRRTSGNSAVQVRDYLNKPARVTVTINPGQRGEVALSVSDAERFVPAVSKREDTGFRVGDQVYVVAYRAGVAEVISRQEYEFLNEGKKEA
jgi:hypothetical protein